MLIACPSCKRQLNVPDNAAGKQVRCPAPDCGTIFIAPSPAAAPVAAAPAAPPAGGGSPFEFGGPAAGPEADFGFTDHQDGGLFGIRLRTRLGRAAGWLNLAAGSIILYMLFVVTMRIASFVLVRSIPAVVIAGCVPLPVLALAVVVLVGARMLARGRRYGFALTAVIISLVVGGLSLLGALLSGVGAAIVIFAVSSAHHAVPGGTFAIVDSCGGAIVLAVVAFCGIFAGIVGLRTLLNAEIKKTFA